MNKENDILKKTDFEYNKLTKLEQDCLTVVEGLGIYELRALSRVFGDNSPTTLKRDEHIKIIMDKIISGEELRPLPLRQGRPHKELSSIQGILDELSNITGKNYSANSDKISNISRLQKNIVFKQIEDDIVSKQLFPIKAKGILRSNVNGDLFFYNQYNFKHVLVSKDFSKKLAPFDFVEGTAIVMNNNNEYITNSIEKINFEDEKNYKVFTSPYKKCNPYENIAFGKNEITLGNRYRINDLLKFTDKKKEIAQLTKTFKENNISTLAIIPNVPDEDILDIQSMGFDNNILFRYNEKASETTYNILLIVNEFIKRQQAIGKSIAIFVQDPVTIINMLDFCFKTQQKCFMGHTEQTAQVFKEFGNLISAAEDGKSTTCFFTFDNSDLFDPLYVSLVYKVYKPLSL